MKQFFNPLVRESHLQWIILVVGHGILLVKFQVVRKKNYIPAMGSPLFERTSRGAERNINQGSVNSFSWVISCKKSQINRSLKNNHETNDITTEVVTVLYVHNIIFARCLSF